MLLDAVMQHPHSHYIPGNSSPDDNANYYSGPLSYAEEHSDPYSNYHTGFQSSPAHVQPNDNRYYTGLDPGLPQYSELAWNNETHQPMQSQHPDFPYYASNSTPFVSTFPATAQHTPLHHMGEDSARNVTVSSAPDMSLYRTAEGPRLRTAQACQKCRARKAKCSGNHPACERCVIKGLICEYATEGRVRANKPRIQPGSHQEFTAGPSSSRPAVDSPYAVTEPSPSAHHARQQMGGPLRSQSEFRYTGGRDIDDRLGTHPGIPHRSSHSSSSSPPFSSNPAAFGAPVNLQHPWAAPSGYEHYYDHPGRYPS